MKKNKIRSAEQHARSRSRGASPDNGEPASSLSKMLLLAEREFESGDSAEAELLCKQALEIHPDCFDALYLLGLIAVNSSRSAEAFDLLARATALRPQDVEAQYNKGNALRLLRRHAAALECYDRAIALDSAHAHAHFNRALSLRALRRNVEALASCENAIRLHPGFADALNCRGILLQGSGDFVSALASFEAAIAAENNLAEAHFNLGTVLQALQRNEAAIASYDRAIKLKPNYALAYNNRGYSLSTLKRYPEATESFRSALALDPELPYVHGAWLSSKMLACDWDHSDIDLAWLFEQIGNGGKVFSPLVAVATCASPALEREVSEIWIRDKYPPREHRSAFPRRANGERLRIGYFSSDFRNHPVALQSVGLFECHDRTRFEITAFSLGKRSRDAINARLEAAFDRYEFVGERSDEEVVSLARDLGIHVAVDLGGHTEGARTGIMAMRAAPIQVNFLGHPGTMGAEYMDYVVGDACVIPEGHREHFIEKVVYMPHTYMPTDAKRQISDRRFRREEQGLPMAGFVFCSFNSPQKISPRIFDCWMRLLKQVDGSVLWLTDPGPHAVKNIRTEASRSGVGADRIIFAERMPSSEEHLARLKLADLFLDTLPYNAHSTACDVLWAGVPMLTCLGKSFAGRAAASLLGAVGIEELVAQNLVRYESLALELARNPERLDKIRHRLAGNREKMPLFDTARYTRSLEIGYELMYKQFEKGERPIHLFVEPE